MALFGRFDSFVTRADKPKVGCDGMVCVSFRNNPSFQSVLVMSRTIAVRAISPEALTGASLERDACRPSAMAGRAA